MALFLPVDDNATCLPMCRYTLCILTTYVKKSVPELERALRLIQSIKGCWLWQSCLYKWLHTQRKILLDGFRSESEGLFWKNRPKPI